MTRFAEYTDLTNNLESKSNIEATKGLTKYFSKARFGFSDDDFDRKYVDGANDGGMDLIQEEDETFYIVQTKFSRTPEKTSKEAVFHELHKIANSLSGENPNTRAEDFVNSFRRASTSNSRLLEIIWLCTDEITDEVTEAAQHELQQIRSNNNWGIQVDFVPFDKKAIRRMVSDSRYGYVPYTGKKEIKISSAGFIENSDNGTGIKSVVFSTRIVDLLKWIRTQNDVTKFLQKNVREYIGDTTINKDLKSSFKEHPDLFWYKHNGIIIFADSVSISPDKRTVVMRNPQIVNGGQTLTALYAAYDKAGRSDSEAEILVRVYRLPYEQLETYEKGLEIIKALNSQNKILASDLHSTDPQQVRLEEHFKTLGYRYHRKRSKEAKSGKRSITMKNLALIFYICEKKVPHAGVVGNIEELFEQKNTYMDIFPKDRIELDIESINHISLSYLTAWRLSDIIKGFEKHMQQKQKALFDYTFYYVLVDSYNKLKDSRNSGLHVHGWRNWKDFLNSEEFEDGLWQYSKFAFNAATLILPKSEEYRQDPRKFYRTEKATEKFLARVSNVRRFNSVMNSAYKSFEQSQEE